MTRRVLVAILVVALGVLGAAWFASGTFTVSRSVMVEPPSVLTDSRPPSPERREMKIECGPNSSYYVTDRGSMLFFNGSTGSPEDPRPLCDEARSQRRQTSVAFVLVGLLVGGAVIVTGRMRERRAAELEVRPADAEDSSHRGSEA